MMLICGLVLLRGARLVAGPMNAPLEHEQQDDQQVQLTIKAKQQPESARPLLLPPLCFRRHQIPPRALQSVDVVYLWVNGSDPAHAASLDKWSAKAHRGAAFLPWMASSQAARSGSELSDKTAQRRFDSSRDELRYSLRSVAQYMPWFRKVFIVTSGQVPTWLDLSNPRVTLVPHSTIFPNPKDLPNFNSHAIQANLHRIPGLADSFVLFDDDFFFTKPVGLDFFVTPDYGEYIFDDWRVGKGCVSDSSGPPCPEDTFGDSIRHVASLYDNRFGSRERHTQGHTPYFIQKKWMQKLQSDFALQFEATSSHHLRSSMDMQFAAAYKWYIIEQGHVHTPVAAESLSSFIMMLNNATEVLLAMRRAWDRTDSFVVCLNDDIHGEEGRAEVNKAVVAYLSEQYPHPSEFELAPGELNYCSTSITSEFGVLPELEDMLLTCANNANQSRIRPSEKRR